MNPMLKKFAFSVVLLTPLAAMAGDGGGMDGTGALLIQAVTRAAAKLLGMF
jgi:hypothetical protein